MKDKGEVLNHLAEQRTHLANERTLLAYWRTSFSFFVVAVFISKFIESAYSANLAVTFIVFSILIFIYGVLRFRKYRQDILNRR